MLIVLWPIYERSTAVTSCLLLSSFVGVALLIAGHCSIATTVAIISNVMALFGAVRRAAPDTSILLCKCFVRRKTRFISAKVYDVQRQCFGETGWPPKTVFWRCNKTFITAELNVDGVHLKQQHWHRCGRYLRSAA